MGADKRNDRWALSPDRCSWLSRATACAVEVDEGALVSVLLFAFRSGATASLWAIEVVLATCGVAWRMRWLYTKAAMEAGARGQ